jgi:peptidyl-prolyl cis-trans isomerase SurA
VLATAIVWGFATPPAAAEDVDRIVAVVGHHIILNSELESQLELAATQQRIDLNQPGIKDVVRADLLDQMISDRLMLIQAERDTLITVSDPEVERELDTHLQRIQSQFPSPEDFYKQLASEGLSLPELRRRYRREVRNQLLKQKLVQSRVRDVEVSAPEVDAFYNEFRDSLPDQVAAVHLQTILLTVEVSQSTKDSVQTFAGLIRDSIQAGASFGDMARRYSSDGSAESGGDLGWFGRKVMVPEFERAAFGLAVGEISGAVKTQFGYHLIKCLERERERVHAAHILFRTTPTGLDQEKALAFAREVRDQLVGGADFAAMAKEHSADSTTAAAGGDLGWIPLTTLPPNFAAAIGTNGAGSLLDPVSAEEGIHIIKVVDRRDDRPYDLELDRAEITEMARREKTGRYVEEWVTELRGEIYVDVRL